MITFLNEIDSFRCASEEQVALTKLLEPGYIWDHGGQIEYHHASVFLLAGLTVDRELDLNIAWIFDGALVDKFRYSGELVWSLSHAPISSSIAIHLLKSSISEIKTNKVSSDMLHDILRLDISASHTDDYAHLKLMLNVVMETGLQVDCLRTGVDQGS